jgi:hypothetical protein
VPVRINKAPAGVASVGATESVVRLDAGLLRIALACLLAGIMVDLDLTVVYIAQRTFATVFDTS